MATAEAAPSKKKTKGEDKAAADAPAPEIIASDDERTDEQKAKDDAEAAAKEREQKAAEEARAEHEAALDALEPMAEPKQWIIGKPPESGGTEDEYSIYVQKPLEYFPRLRFFSLVTKTIGEAIKAGGVINIDGSILGGEGNVRQRFQQLQASDFSDVGSFMQLAMQLVGYAPEFLLECYCMWLSIPTDERRWAKLVMQTPWKPDENKWGLTQAQHMEIVEIFIDQNYEDIRDFFVEELPKWGRRVQARERDKQKAQESESAQSKR